MFHSFTGTSRRPRQVNLSGRNSNPFSAPGTGSPKNALASAQEDRVARQKEREKLNAARSIQRVWRGHRDRRRVKEELRRLWDEREDVQAIKWGATTDVERIDVDKEEGTEWEAYSSAEESLSQLRLLLRFFSSTNNGDRWRLRRYCGRQRAAVRNNGLSCTGGPWPMAYLRLEKICLAALDQAVSENGDLLVELLFIVNEIPEETAQRISGEYYRIMKHVLLAARRGRNEALSDLVFQCIHAPLQTGAPATIPAYEELSCQILTKDYIKEEDIRLGLAKHINCSLLAQAVVRVVTNPTAAQSEALVSVNARIWLVGALVYIGRTTLDKLDVDVIKALSSLLSSLADEVDVEKQVSQAQHNRDNSANMWSGFLAEQFLSLVNQRSVSTLLAQSGPKAPGAWQLASYALTLLRVFPRKGDEIRMWLYLGSASAPSGTTNEGSSAIKYFWRSARATSVFRTISRDSRAAIDLLKVRSASAGYEYQSPASKTDNEPEITDEWRVIFIFFELYSFVLKIMDDEEFFGGISSVNTGSSPWARENALSLRDIKDLTIFLKNVGFTLHFNASDIVGDDPAMEVSAKGLSSFFSASSSIARSTPQTLETKQARQGIGGVTGIGIDYVKGLVTGLLRLIYERDSRRQFLPKDHWLMTSRFDMEGFIPTVVAEEESRRKVRQDDEEEKEDEDTSEAEADTAQYPRYVGTQRAQQTRNIERLQRQQRKASRKRYLQAVAPRQEILQNMPFFIPFETRVQIFREFVLLDQRERRNGLADPDLWRMSIAHNAINTSDTLERHHAKIRRKHEFDDAFEQFYPLGAGLKEPIQITFVDQFDTEEVGIDGGGVTKEFLTSVTSQAFSPSDGINLFVENDQHLLYPNPSAVDELKEILRQIGFKEGSPEFRASVQDLLQRYEFLGRIIGKCLYEGILVDINFAGFFLLKWALTGGIGSAPRESGYRANLNDLRDLDEALYQGLLQLKNYPGDVEDFSLNFTVTDPLHTPFYASDRSQDPNVRTITRELQPNGSSISVTNSNRILYISLIARHRLSTQPFAQTAAFLRGLSSIIEPAWLSMFNRAELQTLVSGTRSSISIPDLRANTQYSGVYDPEHPSIRIFWKVMEMLSDEEKGKVLKFVTSVSRAPLLGFKALNPRFSIRDSGNDESRLPSTSTCVNLLKLPRYSSEKVMRDKLLYAVNSGAGFDLS